MNCTTSGEALRGLQRLPQSPPARMTLPVDTTTQCTRVFCRGVGRAALGDMTRTIREADGIEGVDGDNRQWSLLVLASWHAVTAMPHWLC